MKKWNVSRRELVYKNPFFNVTEEDLVLSNGGVQTYYILNKMDFVSVVAYEGDFLYMIKMDRYTIKDKRSLEIPMGLIEKNEEPIVAAKRELLEEAGVVADEIKPLGILNVAKGSSSQKCFVFLASGLQEGKGELDLMEKESNLEIKKVKISDMGDMIKNGKITDVDTIASYQLFMLNYKS